MPIAMVPRIAQTSSGEAFAGIFHLVDVRGDLLTSADCKHKDREGCEVFDIELRDQALHAQIQRHIISAGIDRAGCKDHDDVKNRHHEHTCSGDGGKSFQRIETAACDPAEKKKHCKSDQL